MIKILAAIIAFLLMIFPNSSTLLFYQQQLDFPGEEVVAEEIIDAIIDSDIEALMNMYCEAAKSTGEVTTDNIEKLIKSLEGNITHGEFFGADGGEYSNNGSSEIHRQIKIKIETSKKEYLVYASWIVADTESPEKVGLIQLTLYPYIWEESRVPMVQIPLTESLNIVRC